MTRKEWKRNSTPLKKTGKLKQGSQLKRGSKLKKKAPTAEKLAADKGQREKDWEFYQKVFSERGNRCEACDVIIYGELTSANADHLIEKSTHPELRYEPENIAVVCITCHANKTNAGPISNDYRQLIEEAKKRFNV